MASGAFIKVDIGKIAEAAAAALPKGGDLNRMVQGLGAAALQFWKKQAQEKLRSSSREYVQALTMENGDQKVVITLTGVLPNLIENGFGGGNMRDWMLRSSRAKQGKNGKYLVIPFQHGTPGTGGHNVGNVMPGSIYSVARKLAATVTRPARAAGGGPTTRWGGRLSAQSPNMNAAAQKILSTKEKPWHQSSIYRGMVREEKTFAKATQTTGYKTFRTISEHGDPRGWIHPGITARRFAVETQKQVGKLAGMMLGAALGDKA